MPRLFVGNFDFERQLVTTGEPSRQLRRINDELAAVWLAVAEAGDLIWCGEMMEESLLEDLASRGCPRPTFISDWSQLQGRSVTELVPWGWSRQMVELCQRLGLTCHAPDPAIVAQANSRQFSAELESELNVSLPLAGPITSLAELQDRLTQFAAAEQSQADRFHPQPTWLLKANHGQAGRERISGHGVTLGDKQLAWIQSRLHQDGVLFFEPLVHHVEEAGIQWMIPRRGDPRLEVIIPLLTAADGGYRASAVPPLGHDWSAWQSAIEVQERAVRRIQELGYSGPVGIDAMQYRWRGESEIRIRPLQDINARWTMGQVANAWSKRLPMGTNGGMWMMTQLCELHGTILTAPQELGSKPVVKRTWWMALT